MGSEAPDASFYREGRLSGGLAYSDDDLRRLFGWMHEVELRLMEQQDEHSPVFGESFLWAGLFTVLREAVSHRSGVTGSDVTNADIRRGEFGKIALWRRR